MDTNAPHHVVSQVSEAGRLEIPAELREQVGLASGGPVIVRVEDGELRIRTVRSALNELQAEAAALFAGTGESVDRFIAERRAEAAKEEQEE